MSKLTAKEFEALVGRPPENDDLDRANCDKAGEIGHLLCGLCSSCGRPVFVCCNSSTATCSLANLHVPPDPLEVPGDPNALDVANYARTVLLEHKIDIQHPFNAAAILEIERRLESMVEKFLYLPNNLATQDAVKTGVIGVISGMKREGLFFEGEGQGQ